MCHGQAIGSQPIIVPFTCDVCEGRVSRGMRAEFRLDGERTTRDLCYQCFPAVRDLHEKRSGNDVGKL